MRVFAAVLLGLLICPAVVLADKKVKNKDREKVRVEYYIPEPDALPLPPRPEVSVGVLSECSLEAGASSESVASGRFGIDVSHYQGRVDWHRVSRDHRVRFVYLKATESTSLVDDTYAYNLHESCSIACTKILRTEYCGTHRHKLVDEKHKGYQLVVKSHGSHGIIAIAAQHHCIHCSKQHHEGDVDENRHRETKQTFLY